MITPDEKVKLIADAHEKVAEVLTNNNMAFITNDERYNQIIDVWTHTTNGCQKST